MKNLKLYQTMKKNHETPLEGYTRHIAHANLIILNKKFKNIQNRNNNEQQ